MQRKIKIAGFAVLFAAALSVTAFTGQQERGGGKKEQQQKGNDKDKGNKGNRDNGNNKGNNNNKNNKGVNEQNENRGNGKPNPVNGKGNKPADKIFDRDNNAGTNNGNAGGNRGNGKRVNRENFVLADAYNWNKETFKERDKYRKGEKVTVCHKFDGNEPAVTLRVSANALKAHRAHGDVVGDCPAMQYDNYSDLYLRNRTDYYNDVQNYYEQVTYSQSILEYAVERLTGARLQLATLQNRNAPLAEIQERRATVLELEQNVSLLETLLGVAATLVVDRL